MPRSKHLLSAGRCQLGKEEAEPESEAGVLVLAEGRVPSARKSSVIWRAALVSGITCRPATPGRLKDCTQRGARTGGAETEGQAHQKVLQYCALKGAWRHQLLKTLTHARAAACLTRLIKSAFHSRTAAACPSLPRSSD